MIKTERKKRDVISDFYLSSVNIGLTPEQYVEELKEALYYWIASSALLLKVNLKLHKDLEQYKEEAEKK